MCTFLTAGVDRRRAAAFEASLWAARFSVSEEVNPRVATLFEPGHALFMVTDGGCSCGLRGPRNDDGAESARMRRFRKRRYSEARIARILAGIPASNVRAPSRHGTLMDTARRFAPVRMCFHQVRGDPREEEVEGKIDFALVLS